VNHFENLLALFASEREARRAHPLRAKAGLLHGQFDVMHELGMRIQVQERREPSVDFARGFPIAATRQLPKILVLPWKRDATACDPAVDAEDRTLQREIIDAGKNP
jgi:hypothetical protein